VKVAGADFDRLVRDAEVPVLVDFYADWCGPCKVIAPVLDEVARERQGRLLVVKLDTDRNPDTTGRFEVRGIPTLILFRGGREQARRTGAVSRAEIESLVGGAPV
jgi:thioredoxin